MGFGDAAMSDLLLIVFFLNIHHREFQKYAVRLLAVSL